MQVQVSGQKIDIGESLNTHTKSEILEIVDKYTGRATSAQVVFSKDAHEHICEASIHLTTGMTVNATGRANDIYESMSQASKKMEKQLRRYKRRLKDHHNQRTTPIETFGAASYILAPEQADSDSDGAAELAPAIIAEMETEVKTLSVGEAVMQMELSNQDVMIFRKEGQEQLNVVYRRQDGNIGWIDPS